jgi:septal ring factor EnvC (AmiA/AmiB activator)
MNKIVLFIFSLLFIFCHNISFGQNRVYYDKLKKDKKSTLTYSKKLLSSLKSDNKSQLDRLLIISEQIRKHREIVSIINREIRLIDEEIELDNQRLEKLNGELKEQKKEYAQLIYFASLNMNVQRRMIYILSAESFNKAYKRIVYLKQLSDFRKNRSESIQSSIRIIDSTVADLKNLKIEKQGLVGEKASELDSLNIIKKKLNKLIGANNSQIAQLNSQVSKDQAKRNVIKKEVSKEIVKQETKTVASNKNTTNTDSKKSHKLEGNITSKFRGKKRWHLWPLEKCVVLHRFGDYHHPTLQHVVVKNDGIELGASGGNNVYSIFEGTVTRVIPIPGDGTSIIIKHGDFYSVYSKVEKVAVKPGEVVTRGQVIASLAGSGKMTKMNFQLWFKKQKLNPELWLKKR